MKKLIISSVLFFWAIGSALSQTTPYNVVFDLTLHDTAAHQKVIRWIKLILAAKPDAKVEVVFYGHSLGMVQKEKSVVAEDVAKLSENKNIAFRACSIAMKKHNVDKSQLIPGVVPVPDGIYEIIKKQSEGYGYIKVTDE